MADPARRQEDRRAGGKRPTRIDGVLASGRVSPRSADYTVCKDSQAVVGLRERETDPKWELNSWFWSHCYGDLNSVELACEVPRARAPYAPSVFSIQSVLESTNSSRAGDRQAGARACLYTNIGPTHLAEPPRGPGPESDSGPGYSASH